MFKNTTMETLSWWPPLTDSCGLLLSTRLLWLLTITSRIKDNASIRTQRWIKIVAQNSVGETTCWNPFTWKSTGSSADHFVDDMRAALAYAWPTKGSVRCIHGVLNCDVCSLSLCQPSQSRPLSQTSESLRVTHTHTCIIHIYIYLLLVLKTKKY